MFHAVPSESGRTKVLLMLAGIGIITRNGAQMFQGDRVGQHINLMCGTYGGTRITHCLVQYIRRWGWERIVEIMHMMHRVDYNIW
jgi:hypothetical protein